MNMTNIKTTTLAAALAAAAVTACTQTPAQQEYPRFDANNHVNIETFADCQAFFSYHPDADVFISAHRGGMQPGYPEDCLASCEKTVAQMPVIIELDFSLTKDSVMVLMHDMTIDRTTNGKGAVADYTYEQLQQFNLVDRDGNVTEYKIPTLNEVLAWGKGKVAFNFDNKYMNTKGVSQEDKDRSLKYFVRQFSEGGDWHEYHNIFICPRSVEEAMYYWDNGVHDLMFCVEVSTPEMFEKWDACPIPWDHIIASSRTALNPEMKPIYKKLHDMGVMITISVTQSDDKIKNPKDRRVAYLNSLVSQPDFIETDYPSEWENLPKDRKTLNSMK